MISLLCVQAINAQTVTFTADRVCLGLQTTLNGTWSAGDNNVSQWMWDLDGDGNYNDGIGKTIFYLFGAEGNHSVGLKVIPISGSADSINNTVIVDALPQVNYSVDNLCAGLSATYTDASSITSGTIDQYLWDFNNDGTVDDNSGPVVSFTNGPAGSYTGKLECISDRGCRSFAIKSAQVYPIPMAGFSVINACLGDAVTLTNTSSISSGSITLNIWTFGDGVQDIGPGTMTHTYTKANSFYTRLVVVSNQFCSDTTGNWVTVYSLPNVDVDIVGDSVLYDGETTKLRATGDPGSYVWSNGATTREITVSMGGVYNVTVTNASNCIGIASASIAVKVLEEVEVRNDLLSPNNDGINDVLFIEDLEGYDACNLKVYNLWGDVVFSHARYNNTWMGTDRSGLKLDGGAYYYILSCDDKAIKKGNINILR